MADAKVIPFGEDRPRRRGGGARGARAVDAVAAPAQPPGPAQESGPVELLAPVEAPAGRAGGAGEWDRRIAGGLAFLRRRITGEYEVDEFGYDKELTDQVLMSLMRPCSTSTSGSRSRAWRTSPRRVGR